MDITTFSDFNLSPTTLAWIHNNRKTPIIFRKYHLNLLSHEGLSIAFISGPIFKSRDNTRGSVLKMNYPVFFIN